VTNKKKEWLDPLIRILEIDSQSDNTEGIEKVFSVIEVETKNLPIKWKSLKAKDAAPLYVGSSEKNSNTLPRIILSGHLDVVTDAKKVKIREGNIYGAGAIDMKGGLIVILEVLKLLSREGLLQNLTVVLNPEEELGSPNHTGNLMRIARNHDYALVFESGYRDSSGNIQIVNSRKGAVAWGINISGGPAGHGSKLTERHSSIQESLVLITSLMNAGSLENESTVNIGTVNAGEAINQLPSNAKIGGEYRFWSKEEKLRIEKEFKKAVARINNSTVFDADYIEKGYFPAFSENKASRELLGFAEVVAREEVELSISRARIMGASDANKLMGGNPNIGIIDGLGPVGDGDHTPKEFAKLGSFDEAIKLSYGILKKIIDR
jgi:glutamate carboxypeptidase